MCVRYPSIRAAAAGALAIAAVNLMFAALWLPRVVGFPGIFGTWGGFFEALAPVTAGVILYATSLTPSPGARGAASAARYLFGACVLSFAVGHFLALPQTAGMVPKWIPPGQTFWAVATGIFHLLAALAILSEVFAILGARLLTAMIAGFGLLVWLPQIFTSPRDHVIWAGNAVNLTLIGAAWVVADWLAADSAANSPESGSPKN